MMENMKINQLPSKTWNWLKMNETAVSGISVSGAHEGNLEIPEGIKKTVCPAEFIVEIILRHGIRYGYAGKGKFRGCSTALC